MNIYNVDGMVGALFSDPNAVVTEQQTRALSDVYTRDVLAAYRAGAEAECEQRERAEWAMEKGLAWLDRAERAEAKIRAVEALADELEANASMNRMVTGTNQPRPVAAPPDVLRELLTKAGEDRG